MVGGSGTGTIVGAAETLDSLSQLPAPPTILPALPSIIPASRVSMVSRTGPELIRLARHGWLPRTRRCPLSRGWHWVGAGAYQTSVILESSLFDRSLPLVNWSSGGHFILVLGAVSMFLELFVDF